MDYDPRIARLIFSQSNAYLQHFDDAALWAHVCINASYNLFLLKLNFYCISYKLFL